jgi:hypothetical protein
MLLYEVPDTLERIRHINLFSAAAALVAATSPAMAIAGFNGVDAKGWRHMLASAICSFMAFSPPVNYDNRRSNGLRQNGGHPCAGVNAACQFK